MSRGGFRIGAGRKANSGSFGEKTVIRRIPASISTAFDSYIQSLKSGDNISLESVFYREEISVSLPLFSNKVAAGFPSPAEEGAPCHGP
jgi:DNA polymerase V